MGNQPARPNLTSHSAGNWHWDTATDIFQLTVKQETGPEHSVYVLNVTIPFGHGVCREDIRIMTKDGVLTIYGRRPVDKEIPSKTLKDLFVKYPHYTSFERNLQLPNFLDASSMEPRWVHDGLLEIRIKKRGDQDENQIEIAEMPTLTDPRYGTPMIKQDFKVVRSDSENEQEEKEEKKQNPPVEEEKVEEIDADKAKPPQTVILPGANKQKDEKKKQSEKEEPKQSQSEKEQTAGKGKGEKTAEKGKPTDNKEKTKSKKKVSKDKSAKKGKK